MSPIANLRRERDEHGSIDVQGESCGVSLRNPILGRKQVDKRVRHSAEERPTFHRPVQLSVDTSQKHSVNRADRRCLMDPPKRYDRVSDSRRISIETLQA